MQKENCRAAHTAIFCLCEMVSTNFKHINANIIICCCKFLFGTNWIHWYHVGVGSSCGKQVHLCDNENGFLYLSWKHSDFQGLSRTVSLSFITNDPVTPVYLEWPIHPPAIWLSDERLFCLTDFCHRSGQPALPGSLFESWILCNYVHHTAD